MPLPLQPPSIQQSLYQENDNSDTTTSDSAFTKQQSPSHTNTGYTKIGGIELPKIISSASVIKSAQSPKLRHDKSGTYELGPISTTATPNNKKTDLRSKSKIMSSLDSEQDHYDYDHDADCLNHDLHLFGIDPSSSSTAAASDDVLNNQYERLNDSYQKQMSNTLKLTNKQYKVETDIHMLQEDNRLKEEMIRQSIISKNQTIKEETLYEKTLFKYLVRFPKERDLHRKHDYKSQIAEWNALIADSRQAIITNNDKLKTLQNDLINAKDEVKLSKKQESIFLTEMKKISDVSIQLPMVVGTNIKKIDMNTIDNDDILRMANETNNGDGPATATLQNEPKRLQSYVNERSKMFLYDDIKDDAVKINRDFKTVQQDLWIKKQEIIFEKEDTNQIISKLANLAQEMNLSRIKYHKSNVVDSIKLFFINQVKLRPVETKSQGILNWYDWKQKKLCRNIEMYSSVLLPTHSPIIHGDELANRQKTQEIAERESQKHIVNNNQEKEKDDETPRFDSYSNAYNGLKALVSSHRSKTEPRVKSRAKGADNNSNNEALVSLSDAYAMNRKMNEDDPTQTAVIYEGGVTLGKEFVGTCFGSMQLPKRAVWAIHLLIVRQVQVTTAGNGNPLQSSSASSSSVNQLVDETDHVTMQIGNSLSSLCSVGTFYNRRINPDYSLQPRHLPYIVHDVIYNFKGDHLTYRFDFHSSSLDATRHLAVVPGNYTEYVMPPLELTYSRTHDGRLKQHALSSYVKQLRVEEKQGQVKLARLQEEYIRAAEAQVAHEEALTAHKIKESLVKTIAEAMNDNNYEAPPPERLYWDSSVINETKQRYTNVNHFLSLVETEILREAERMRKFFDMNEKKRRETMSMSVSLSSSLNNTAHTVTSAAGAPSGRNSSIHKKAKKSFRKNSKAKGGGTSGDESADDSNTAWSLEKQAEARLKESRDGYLQRKQASLQHVIDEAERKVGSLVEYQVQTSERRTWKQALIKRLKVAWLDDGTKLSLSYILQDWKYVDASDNEEKQIQTQVTKTASAATADVTSDSPAPVIVINDESAEYELDLSLFRHFTVTMEEATMIHNNRMRAKFINYDPLMEEELTVVNGKESHRIAETKDYFETLFAQAERKFKRKKRAIMKRVETVSNSRPPNLLTRGISNVASVLRKSISNAALMTQKSFSNFNMKQSSFNSVAHDESTSTPTAGGLERTDSMAAAVTRSRLIDRRHGSDSDISVNSNSDNNSRSSKRSLMTSESNYTRDSEFEQYLDDEVDDDDEDDEMTEENKIEQLAIFTDMIEKEILLGKLHVPSPNISASTATGGVSSSDPTANNSNNSTKISSSNRSQAQSQSHKSAAGVYKSNNLLLTAEDLKRHQNEFVKMTAEMRLQEHIINASKEKKLKFLNLQLDLIQTEYHDARQDISKQRDITQNNIKRDCNIERHHIKQNYKNQKEKQRLELIRSVTIDAAAFEKAVKRPLLCQHLKTKAWSSLYAHGIRCEGCDKEMLTETWLEECQYKGYGYDQPLAFHHNRERFNLNEYAYHFDTSEELQYIEDDKLWVEKERRKIALDEIYFYDYIEPEFVGKFDRRHALNKYKDTRYDTGNKMMQLELESSTDPSKSKTKKSKENKNKSKSKTGKDSEAQMAREMEKQERENATKRKEKAINKEIMDNPTISTVETNFIDESTHLVKLAASDNDGWEGTVCTYREPEVKHRIQFRELLFNMGRLGNFTKKIDILVNERQQLKQQNNQLIENITVCHDMKELQTKHLIEIEYDLDKISGLIDTYRKMIKLWYEAQLILIRAIEERERVEVHYKIIKEAKEIGLTTLTQCNQELHVLLKLKNDIHPKIKIFEYALQRQVDITEEAKKVYLEQTLNTHTMRYAEPGAAVMTKYGYGTVRSYREADNIVFVTLCFCRPPAKLYMSLAEVSTFERKLQEKERNTMSDEEDYTRMVLFKEGIKMKRELYRMRKEDSTMKVNKIGIDIGILHKIYI